MRVRMDEWNEEWIEWALMTPAQRFVESNRLWEIYLAWGGSLDPEPDLQSPFDCEELERAVPGDGGTGLHIVRRSGV